MLSLCLQSHWRSDESLGWGGLVTNRQRWNIWRENWALTNLARCRSRLLRRNRRRRVKSLSICRYNVAISDATASNLPLDIQPHPRCVCNRTVIPSILPRTPQFYRAMLCIRGTIAMALCLSVCPSQAGVLLKRQNVGSHKQHHTIPQGLSFSGAKDLREIRPGAPNAGGVGQNRRLSTNNRLYLENGKR